MKKLLVLIILSINLSLYGQNKRSPTIVILNSQETIIPIELDSIMKSFVRNGLTKEAKENIRNENGEFKLKAEKEIQFLEETDVATNVSYGLNYFLSYKFFEHFPNLLIYPVKEANQSDLKSLKFISEKHNVNWVVNIEKLEFFIADKKNRGKVKFQLYNQKINQILLEEEIEVDDNNHGFEFACKSGTITCIINNSISLMSLEIMTVMKKNKKYWR